MAILVASAAAVVAVAVETETTAVAVVVVAVEAGMAGFCLADHLDPACESQACRKVVSSHCSNRFGCPFPCLRHWPVRVWSR